MQNFLGVVCGFFWLAPLHSPAAFRGLWLHLCSETTSSLTTIAFRLAIQLPTDSATLRVADPSEVALAHPLGHERRSVQNLHSTVQNLHSGSNSHALKKRGLTLRRRGGAPVNYCEIADRPNPLRNAYR